MKRIRWKTSKKILAEQERARLELSILKENFDYRDFFQKALEQEQFPLEELCKRFKLNDSFFESAYMNNIPFVDIFTLLNPEKDAEKISTETLLNRLPYLFYRPGLTDKVSTKLEAWERMLVIDLRKRKAELLSQLEAFIDVELAIRESFVRHGEPYKKMFLWTPETSRQRKEAAEQLKVWKLRSQYHGFPSIARKLNISEDLAKKRFYKAFELTQRGKYDPVKYKRERENLPPKNSCANCPDKANCTELCPSMMQVLKMTEISLREIRFTDYEAKTGLDLITKKPRR